MGVRVQGLCPVLQVFDMPTSLRFYRDLFGFEIVEASRPSDNADWVWLQLDGAELLSPTAYHYLRNKGLVINEPKTAWYGMRQLYVKDPDGFNICFQWKAEKE